MVAATQSSCTVANCPLCAAREEVLQIKPAAWSQLNGPYGPAALAQRLRDAKPGEVVEVNLRDMTIEWDEMQKIPVLTDVVPLATMKLDAWATVYPQTPRSMLVEMIQGALLVALFVVIVATIAFGVALGIHGLQDLFHETLTTLLQRWLDGVPR